VLSKPISSFDEAAEVICSMLSRKETDYTCVPHMVRRIPPGWMINIEPVGTDLQKNQYFGCRWENGRQILPGWISTWDDNILVEDDGKVVPIVVPWTMTEEEKTARQLHSESNQKYYPYQDR
jgi:hypothetical protein